MTQPTISATAAAPCPGVTMFVRTADGTALHVSHGFASLEHRVPIGPHTVMNVGSVAKQITAYVAIRAAGAHRIDLDTPVAAFLPTFSLDDVTLLDVIRHAGGVRDAESMLSLAGLRDLDHYTAADLLQLSFRQQHRAVPAGTFLYSNTGYLLLTEVIRKIYGESLQAAATELLFGPLGMTTAQFREHPSQIIPHGASGYEPTPVGSWRSAARPVALAGPGALWCSVSDLDRWLEHLHTRWLEDGAPLPLSRQVPYLQSDRHPYLYGPGVYGDASAADPAVFHAGHEQGFSAIAQVTISGRRLVGMSNRADMPVDQLAFDVVVEQLGSERDLREIVTHAMRRISNVEPANRETPDECIGPGDTLGTYTCTEVPGTLHLERIGDQLRLRRRGTFDLLSRIRTSPATYAGQGVTITFEADPQSSAFADIIVDLDRAPGLRYQRTPNLG